MAALAQELRKINERLDRIEVRLPPEESVTELREVTDDVAREEIAALFSARTGETLYYGDIAEALRLPLEQVVDVCGQLIDEGTIGIGEHE